jgi:hypothetical protein
MKMMVPAVAAMLLLAGCSTGVVMSNDPSASTDTSVDQQRCDLWGGYWNRTARICESPTPR